MSSSRDSTTKEAPFRDSGSCANTRRSLKPMSSLSEIQWNSKPRLHWEWEFAAAPITSKPTENTKIWPSIDWGIEADDQIASGSLISYQGDCGSGINSGETSIASMSKSSKSTSMSSSSTEDKKMFKSSVEAIGKVQSEDFISKKDDFSRTSPTFESSVCSGESLLNLKLGKRAYFEDISDRNNSKRTRSSFHNVSAVYCQVEGCILDLASTKGSMDYPSLTRTSISCRKRLSDHNARRRRPHPNVAHFDPKIIYGGGLQHVFSRIRVEDNSTAVKTSLISSSQPPQHLHRALSLLSTDSSQPRSVPVPAQGPHFPASAAPELWHAEEQWSNNPKRLTMNHEPGNTHNFNNGSSFQECLLQHEFGFGLMHLN